MGLFTASFLPMSRAVTPFEQTILTLQQFSCRRAVQKHHSPRRTPLISQQRAAMSLLTFFLCHLGAPCITATIKIEAAKISLPKGVWVSKGALLDHMGTGCGMLHAGRRTQQLWLGQHTALELGSTDGQLCSNDKAELLQRCSKCKALGLPDLHRAG